ncbi:hypothetical protein MJ634_003155 [Providencia rettgeri]|uniref:hypothetical protein n=1 Tax=Providencia rettgeri TaxID=587 RepID=UPI001B391075|nr:hypothetical protein [Providencia rettgeri]ELR5089746.1 hypothetical protein [Providencia rettgeri]MBQ0605433.1 hypothetical protein [Providencia rettgeri]MCJ2222056.1 hypothetical protein [Providencia rettgeri]MDI7242422.1 hypothetical protein [Providencia rettgeri]MDY0819517.1 hypothetical protein [Providencia rettgeri]
MKKVAIALIALAVSFAAGFMTSGIFSDNQQMTKQIAGQQKYEKDLAFNIDQRKQADEEQQNRVVIYNEQKERATMRTDALLERVLNHFDSVQLEASTTETKTDGTTDADTCGAERAKTSELSRQLRRTLEVYGRESKRADENTSALNLCITDLAEKEKLLKLYK